MNLQLRTVATHPCASPDKPTHFIFSTSQPFLYIAAADLLLTHHTATTATTSTLRAPSLIIRLAYAGASRTLLAFLDNGQLASYYETSTGLRLANTNALTVPDRPVTLVDSARHGRLAAFCKTDSPSVWCLPVRLNSPPQAPFKLRADIEGLQDNVNFLDGSIAKLRAKVATNQSTRPSPVIALAVHPTHPVVAAAYANGLIRVWDVERKEQRSHLSVQPLLAESIVDIALHPTFPTLVACTSAGRIISFELSHGIYKRGDQPMLPKSIARIRKRRFQSMCFAYASPSYLLLLTASNRVIIRLVNQGGVIMASTRFPKPSRPLHLTARNSPSATSTSLLDDLDDDAPADTVISAVVQCDPAFGFIACTLDCSGSIYIFQHLIDQLPALQTPLATAIDTPLASVEGQSNTAEAFTGAVNLYADTVLVYNNTLFLYTLGTEQLVKIGGLPPGDVRSLQLARDENGHCVGALVFYDGDDMVESTDYVESLEKTRYVLATRLAADESWSVSEAVEGRSGCFLGEVGRHDSMIIVDNEGRKLSVSSFVSSSSPSGARGPRRGVQRFEVPVGKIGRVFRTPFAEWNAVLYFDTRGKRLTITKNAYASSPSNASGKSANDAYQMDADTALALRDSEVVLDVRWQHYSAADNERSGGQYLGAIMTDRRIYLVRDVMNMVTTFDFVTIARMIVPFVPPSIAWMGPSVMVLYGNSLFSVTMDGRHDLVASLSNGEGATALVACLPDRVVYAAPSFTAKPTSLVVRSRPCSSFSSTTRGMLALLSERNLDNTRTTPLVQHVVERHDVSQGSVVLADTLISSGLAGMAYAIAMSDKGKYIMPSVTRGGFLSNMGDIRGALAVVEAEYKRLPCGDAFHEGTELFRLLQKVLNMAFLIGDFDICRRCSQLLGRRGTFSSFVNREGGYDALRIAMDEMARRGDRFAAEKLGFLVERSGNSSTASDIGVLPSRREVRAMRQAIAIAQQTSFTFSAVDRRDMFITVVRHGDGTAAGGGGVGTDVVVCRVELSKVTVRNVTERMEIMAGEVAADGMTEGMKQPQEVGFAEFVDAPAVQRPNRMGESAPATNIDANVGAGPHGEGGGEIADSSDDDNLRAETQATTTAASQRLSTSNIEHMMPPAGGKLTPATMEGIADTQQQLQLQVAQSRATAQAASAAGREIAAVQAASLMSTTGSANADEKARDLVERASTKLREGRTNAALKDVENAIRSLARCVQRGVTVDAGLLGRLVEYRFACRLRVAMEEVEASELGQSVAGKMTYTQFATAATRLSKLSNDDRVDALVRCVDGHMLLGNFGLAAQGLRVVKEIGVPEGMREGLRKRYAACQTRGFANGLPLPESMVCFSSLKVVSQQTGMMRCSACVAVYSAESGVVPGNDCEYCLVGRVVVRGW